MAGATAFGIPYPQLADPVVPPTNFKNMADKVQELLEFPVCKLILPSNFPVANNSNTVSVPFPTGSELIKTHPSMHSISTNNTRIIPPRTGIYLLTADAVFDNNTSGVRTMTYGKNGVRQAPEKGIYAGLPAQTVPLPGIATEVTVNTVGDYFELFVYQNSGGGLNLIGDGLMTTTKNTLFGMAFQRPLP